MGIFEKLRNKKAKKKLPPVPDWKPEITQPLEIIIDRVRYYTDEKKDFAVFNCGTCVILQDDLSDDAAIEFAKEALLKIYNYHPDMSPIEMDDGNILVRYNHPAVNVVLNNLAVENWKVIDQNHRRALVMDEVIITPLGHNVFDDFGKKALFGRCFMFMDAQNPEITRIVRKAA